MAEKIHSNSLKVTECHNHVHDNSVQSAQSNPEAMRPQVHQSV
jgi:hypothetical protein